MDSVIKLYQSFPKYKDHSYQDIYYHILPSINYKQYKKFEDDKGLYGFVNWAFLSEAIESEYKKNGLIYKTEWKSGNQLWLQDILILRNPKTVMSWVYNYFKKFLNVNQAIHWLRLDSNNNIYRISKKYKREFHK